MISKQKMHAFLIPVTVKLQSHTVKLNIQLTSKLASKKPFFPLTVTST